MAFRFQRRLKLFPGVRLNFSRGGISTTIGVRGASLTLGQRGAYANLGLPGTGLSYREKIGPRAGEPKSAVTPPWSGGSAPAEAPEYPLPGPSFDTSPASVPGAIRSAHVSTLTSAGLGELKKLINEAAVRHIELTTGVEDKETSVRRTQRRLYHAKWFIIRLFTKRKVRALTAELASLENELAELHQQLQGCSVEIDFAFDQPTLDAFAALLRSFDALRACQKIWDITASVLTNRVVERTTATRSITRTQVRLGLAKSDIIDTNYQALFFRNANGNDIYVYPGFVMMRAVDSDFALIDARELGIKFSQSSFIEEESVPSDGEVVGQAWKKANKDGTPDRRFNGNYQIPVLKYAELELRSATGIYEVYQFSSFASAQTFYEAFISYQKAVATLAERSKDASAAPLVSTHGSDAEAVEPEAEQPASNVPQASRVPENAPVYVFDWVALLLLCFGFAASGLYTVRNWTDIRTGIEARMLPPEATSSAPSTNPVASSGPLGTTPAAAARLGTGAAPQRKRETAYVIKPSVNIRSDPSMASRIVGNLKLGVNVEVFERHGEWVEVGTEAPKGWVHQTLLGSSPP